MTESKITAQHLEIYFQHNESQETLYRFGTKTNQDLLPEEIWNQIDKCICNIQITNSNKCSEKLKTELRNEVELLCDFDVLEILLSKIEIV